tara:strand:+ start:1312 stop:2211 length:900 start_codon:yes stop_codon:yes gene_type:complete
MKLLYFLFIFCTINSFGQESRTFNIKNIVDSISVEDAYILLDGKISAISDSSGKFSIESGTYSQLQISHIGYKSLFISIIQIEDNKTFFLKPNRYQLDEVVVTNRKVKDTILPSLSRTTKKVRVKSWSSNENTLYATFVPNMNGVNAVINKIIVEPGKGQYGDPNKQFIPFKVNLFYMNAIDSLPKDKVLSQSILAFKDKTMKQKYVTVDISEFEIDFPSTGIFVVVETLTLSEIPEYIGISSQPTGFAVVKRKKNSLFRTYDRIYTSLGHRIGKDWIGKNFPLYEMVFNFGIEIEYLD